MFEKISHRGILSIAQENTIKSIEETIKKELDVINLDVTWVNNKNNGIELILCHDRNLLSLTGFNVDLSNTTREEIDEKYLINDVLYYDRNQGKIEIKYSQKEKFNYLEEVYSQYIDKIKFWLDIKDPDYRIWHCGSRFANRLVEFLSWQKPEHLKRTYISSTNMFIMAEIICLFGKTRSKINNQLLKDIIPFGFDMGDGAYHKFLNLLTKLYIWYYKSKIVFVSRTLITNELINNYHNKSVKIIGYTYEPNEEITNNLDGILYEYM